MSIKLMSAIFETEFFDLEDGEGNKTKASTAKLVLLALADHANDYGEGAYPGLDRMEKKTALSRQGIINTYDALKHNGIILLEGRSRLNTNNYTINTQAFPRTFEERPLLISSQAALLVNPLDSEKSTHLTLDSKATLPESSVNHQSNIIASANKEVDFILKSALSPKAIQNAVAKYFQLTPQWEGNKFNRQWMQWAMEQGVTPEQIERAADLWRTDKRFNWQPPSLKLIQERWLQLTDHDNKNDASKLPSDGKGFYA